MTMQILSHHTTVTPAGKTYTNETFEVTRKELEYIAHMVSNAYAEEMRRGDNLSALERRKRVLNVVIQELLGRRGVTR